LPLCDGKNDIYEFKFDHMKGELKFRKAGYKEAFQFLKAFARKHDAEKFSLTDNTEVNFTKYKIQFLLNYIGLLYEVAKQRVAIEINTPKITSNAPFLENGSRLIEKHRPCAYAF